jgi:acyl-CoA thioester hydrolase
LNDFVHETDIEVRFRDTDAMGHVNNAVYLTYVEMARQAYLHAAAPDVRYDAVPFVVGRIEIDFRSPTRTGDVLRPMPVPDWLRAALERIEGRSLPARAAV